MPISAQSWTADNGNGTFTNPLFYDEFSDPDIIRVGDDFYLAGTTMHSIPGVVVLHSKDLVNWRFCSYAMDRFNMGDEFKLENGKEAYGQGIWAPCIRYHDGKFYIFSNINGHGMQVFIADKAEGPWKHINMGGNIYDLSVLFDDDGKIYAIHKYGAVRMTEIKSDFSGFVDDSERVIIPAGMPWAKDIMYIRLRENTIFSVLIIRRWGVCSVLVPTGSKGHTRRVPSV